MDAKPKVEILSRGGYAASSLSVDEKVKLSLEVGEECIQEDELRALFEKKEKPICYDGFEPSGRMHIAQGIMKVINVNRLTSSGCIFVFWVADWFALLNNKMGGDLEKIRKVGEYFIHVWKAAGMDLTNVRFLWASEEIEKHSSEYWLRVMDVAKRNTINRIKRCSQIMGRSEGDDQPSAQIMYPCMQCADIFFIGADICQLGMDQRKVNVLAREYVDSWNKDHASDPLSKPVILSHRMMPGLLEGQQKMSKSDPNSAIFMEDTEQDVKRKIKKAYCPPNVVDDNPIVAYVEMLVFPKYAQFTIERSDKNGGNVTYDSFDRFKADYLAGSIHPADLKSSLAAAINRMIEPVRQHFATDPEAKKLLEEIRKF